MALGQLSAFKGQLSTGDSTLDGLLDNLRTRINDLEQMFALDRYLVNDDRWFNLDAQSIAPFFMAFDGAIDENSDGGAQITANEITNILQGVLPVEATSEMLDKLVARWNRSLDYWDRGIFKLSDLAAGMNPDFIDRDTFQALSEQGLTAIANFDAQGYEDPGLARRRRAHGD